MSSFLQSVFPGASEPDVSYNFVVLIGIRPFGDFRSVTGAGISLAPQNIVEGGRNHSPHILPYGRDQVMKWGEVTLRWGTPVWSTLYDWADAVRVGKFFRRDVFVIQLKRNGWPTRLMRFAGAWPISWKASPLDTASSEWSLSELTLVYEDFNMILTRTDSLADLVGKLESAAEAVGDAVVGFGEGVADFVTDPTGTLEDFGESIYDGMEDFGDAAVEAWEDEMMVNDATWMEGDDDLLVEDEEEDTEGDFDLFHTDTSEEDDPDDDTSDDDPGLFTTSDDGGA